MPTKLTYNEKYALRTKLFATQVIRFYVDCCKKSDDELKMIGKQLFRSGTSVGANFRAFVRGRSEAEKFSKMCIVLEEIDETLFWLELLEEAGLISSTKTKNLKNEAEELVKIFSVSRKNLHR